MKNRFLACLLACIMVLSAAVSASAVEQNPNLGQDMYPGTAEKGAITVECSTMSVMNPILMTYNTEFSIARHCYDALVKLDKDNNLIPGAAESWTSSEDGLTWTFKIRQGGKWVNYKGEVIGDVTANDFVFAFKELLNPVNAAEYFAFATIFENAQAYYDYLSGVEGAPEVKFEDVGIKALDDYTLELKLQVAQPYFLQTVKFEVLSPAYEPFYTECGDKYASAPEYMCFNGAFYMTEWVLENRIVTVKNPYWYDAANVSIDKINWVKYTDTNAKMNAFQGGEIDIIDITGAQRKQFEAEGFTVSSYVGGYSFYAWMNVGDSSEFRSVNLRQAVSAAIDRTQLIKTVYQNNNLPTPCYTFGISGITTTNFSDAVVAANGGQPLYNPVADVEKAKEYLAKALVDLGYTDASQINLTIMTSEGTQNELTSQVIQEQLRANLGIDLKIEVLTITEWRARRNAKQFDFCMGGWGPDYNDPMTDLELFTTDNGNNHTNYASAEYDELVEKAKTEVDMVARENLFIQCEFLIQRDLPIIPVYWRSEDYVASEKLAGGYVRMPFQGYNLFYTKLAE